MSRVLFIALLALAILAPGLAKAQVSPATEYDFCCDSPPPKPPKPPAKPVKN